VHLTPELAKARQQDLLEDAATRREVQLVRVHGRMQRRAERADRQLVDNWHRATKLRARLAELEATNWQ
jgi:hypothetical protein